MISIGFMHKNKKLVIKSLNKMSEHSQIFKQKDELFKVSIDAGNLLLAFQKEIN